MTVEKIRKQRPCLKCGELTEELLYHRECLDQLIRESAEEIQMLEAKKAKLEKELGLWPYGSVTKNYEL